MLLIEYGFGPPSRKNQRSLDSCEDMVGNTGGYPYRTSGEGELMFEVGYPYRTRGEGELTFEVGKGHISVSNERWTMVKV
jgi:hypothetical protein